MVRGTFAGHIHSNAKTNTSSLFTQVGSVDQAGSDSFFVANISAANDWAIVLDPKTDDLITYSKAKGATNAVSNASNWLRGYIPPKPKPKPKPPSPPPSPPGPLPPAPPPGPRGGKWQCHMGTDNHRVLMEPPFRLKDKDFIGNSSTVEACEAKCELAAGCAAVVWHSDDLHCHTLTGALTAAQFTASLRPGKASESCFNTATAH